MHYCLFPLSYCLILDGDARFANDDTIVIHQRETFLNVDEYDIITNATDVNGNYYNIVELPQTSQPLAELNNNHGVYTNYYVGNDVVVFPIFNDPNDQVAADILKGLYPSKRIAQIVFTELYKDGGIAHCVTMQQPAATTATRAGNIRTHKTTRAHHSKNWGRTEHNKQRAHARAHKHQDGNW